MLNDNAGNVVNHPSEQCMFGVVYLVREKRVNNMFKLSFG